MTLVRKILLASAALAAAGVSACATDPLPGPPVAVFDPTAFAWSTAPGDAGISGQVFYAGGGQRWTCAGSVGLTPETPWTRQRFISLYASAERAAVPASVVRARSVSEASTDYQAFVRSTTCDGGGRFSFEGLPAGNWYLIAPVTREGQEPVVLMRRVQTRAGQSTEVTLD